ncbi:MAG TPA: type VI secretion system protein TssR [Saprospiraceae bacterium]|nr:type VI secretion system protein TssR [Saprospiraceae bacterium]
MRLLYFILLFTFTNQLLSQSSVKLLGSPIDYDFPLDKYFSSNKADLNFYINNNNLRSSKEKPWMVISDRSGNQAFKKPEASSAVQSTLEYLGIYYVVELAGDFARLIRVDGGIPRSLQIPQNAVGVDIGWIKRTNLLQWTDGLVDENSKISLKGLLLNKAVNLKDIVNLQNKELVQIFESPYSNTSVGAKNIYEIFYILKKENGRVLLSSEYSYRSSPSTKIIGWVDETRVSKWNTRIALEPNHLEAAFAERKENNNFRFAFFGNIAVTQEYVKTGKLPESGVLFNNDPVTLTKDKLSKSNPRRYKGSIIRYPILTNHKNLFGTGVIGNIISKDAQGNIGTISEVNYGNFVDKMRIRKEEDKNVNILFMVEGSTELNAYKDKLCDIVKNIPSKFPGSNYVNVGCAIYADFQSGQKPVLLKDLTQDRNEVISFIQNTVFYRPPDDDKETTFRHALKFALINVGKFQPGQRNILVVIGNAADFVNNRIRAVKSEKSPYLITGDEMGSAYKALADLDMNVIFIQPSNKPGRAFDKFQSDGLELLSETSKQIYNEINKLPGGAKIDPPFIPDVSPDDMVSSKAGVNYYGFFTPEKGIDISPTRLDKELSLALKSCNEMRDNQLENLYKVVEEGRSLDVSPGEYQPYIMRFLQKELEGVDAKTLSKFQNEKYQLFQEAYLPKRPSGAKFPLYSYVMFLPRKELGRFKNDLNDLANAYNAGYSFSELRQSLKDALSKLVLLLSSESSRAKVEEYDMSRILQVILGLNQEGVVIFETLSTKELKNITKSGVFSDQEILALAKSFSNLKIKLDDIYKQGSRYEYCFRNSGDDENLYFWISLDDILDASLF